MEWFKDKDNILIALSGGVDSALVAYAAFLQLGSHAIAVTADYRTLSKEELDAAKSICTEIGIRQIMLEYDELENPNFVINDNTRCYHCRMELGRRLASLAKQMDGLWVVTDGTNLDDLGDYRPGIEAMRENSVRSPLIETGFSKSDVRAVVRDAGLSIHDRPSNSCLASRIPWGVRITAGKLARIELGERIVRQMSGARQVRVRDIAGSARIEVEPEILHVFDNVVCGDAASDALAHAVDVRSHDDYSITDANDDNCMSYTSSRADRCLDVSDRHRKNLASNYSDHNSYDVGNGKKLLDVIAEKLVMIGFDNVVLDPDGYKTGKLNDVVLD